jgi:uncharacterized membrane protein HdeD (DUF308 family)
MAQAGTFTGGGTRIWGWFVGVGAALAFLGGLASADLFLATIATTFVVGGLMFAGGILQIIHAFGVRRLGWALFWLLSGLLYLAAAASVLHDPLFAAGLLTLFLGVMLGASGLARMVIALRWRGQGWGWMLASGLASIGVAVVIVIGWPVSAIWTLGLLLAVDLLFQGAMLMLTGFALRAARL